MTSSTFERWGGAALLIVLATAALYSGGQALVTGEFAFRGFRSNPLAESRQVGLAAYLSGAFLVGTGVTLLILPFVNVWRSRAMWVLLAVDLLLFVAAALLVAVR
jgi:hypothetical protein